MQPADFLSMVLPRHGTRVLVEFTAKGPRNHTYDEATSFEEIAHDAQQIDSTGNTVYMALAGYTPETVSRFKGRTQDNAQWFRALWIDIDVGEKKDYHSRKDAAHAVLTRLVGDTGDLPVPLLISSGNGLHVYWALDQDIDLSQWRAASSALHDLAIKRGLRFDTRCTTDAARILRPVGTHNYKTTPPREVKVLHISPAVALTAFQKFILTQPAAAATPVNGKHHDAFGLSSIDSLKPEDFSAKKIIAGCQQFQWAYINQSEVKEPMWRAMIGTLYRTDKPSAIHKFSAQHPTYTYDECEEKAKAWSGGGVTCATLESLRPGGCAGCPKYGEIKSPSWFGVKTPAPLPPTTVTPETGLPKNWLLHGGVLCMQSDDGPQLLYDGDIAFGDPYKDFDPFSKNMNLVVPIHATTKAGHHHELHLNMSDVASPTDLKRAFYATGIVPDSHTEKEFLNGMRAWIQKVAAERSVTKTVRQMGWQTHDANDTKATFVIGGTAYEAGGTISEVHLAKNDAIARHMKQHGTLAEWKRAVNMYMQPEYAAYAPMSWLMFGSPLARLFGMGMPIAHFISQGSGHGKTGVQELLLSAAGDPRDPNAKWHGNATLPSIYAYLTTMNGNIAVFDETSTLHPDVVDRLMYEMTLGSGRKVMQGASGITRDNPPISGIFCTSGNVSMQQLAMAKKSSTSAQIARVFEFNIRRPDLPPQRVTADAEVFQLVYSNYGHAMPIFIRHVVDNQAAVKAMLGQVHTKLLARFGSNNEERFWRGLLTVSITGALIARQLGLIDHDVNALLPAAFAHYEHQRGTLKEQHIVAAHWISQFIQDVLPNILHVDTNVPQKQLPGAFCTVIRGPSPHVPVRGRYVADVRQLAVDQRFLQVYCTERGIDLRSRLWEAQQNGALVSAGMRCNLTARARNYMPVRATCVVFDLTKIREAELLMEGTNGSQ